MSLTGHRGMSAVGPIRVAVDRMNAPMIISMYALMAAAATQRTSKAVLQRHMTTDNCHTVQSNP